MAASVSELRGLGEPGKVWGWRIVGSGARSPDSEMGEGLGWRGAPLPPPSITLRHLRRHLRCPSSSDLPRSPLGGSGEFPCPGPGAVSGEAPAAPRGKRRNDPRRRARWPAGGFGPLRPGNSPLHSVSSARRGRPRPRTHLGSSAPSRISLYKSLSRRPRSAAGFPPRAPTRLECSARAGTSWGRLAPNPARKRFQKKQTRARR